MTYFLAFSQFTKLSTRFNYWLHGDFFLNVCNHNCGERSPTFIVMWRFIAIKRECTGIKIKCTIQLWNYLNSLSALTF